MLDSQFAVESPDDRTPGLYVLQAGEATITPLWQGPPLADPVDVLVSPRAR